MAQVKEETESGQASLQELDRPGKIMVSGIPFVKDYKEAFLEKAFSPFGRITEVSVVRDKRTRLPRGFAFITYENPEDAEVAIKAMEGKDLGGESKAHCEPARIGLKKSLQLKNNQNNPQIRRGGQGSGRGSSRGQGRGREPNTGMELIRGKGLINRGSRGMPNMGRGLLEEPRFDFPEEEYIDDFFEPEQPFAGFLLRGGRGGLLGRGGPLVRGGLPARGRPASQSLAPSGGRKALLPEPILRGGRIAPYQPQPRGPLLEDYYVDDANEGDYYGDQGQLYPEGPEEPYSEEIDYPVEEYYEQEWSAPPRGRGGLISRGRGLLPRVGAEARAPRYQMDDYDYAFEGAPSQRSRAQDVGPVPRRAQLYGEEMYDDSDIRTAGLTAVPNSRGRGRSQVSAILSAPAARPGRPGLLGRGGAAPGRRAPLLEADPYAEEDITLYERAVPSSAALRTGARMALDYDDDSYVDPYEQAVATAGVLRQQAVGRPRAALLSSNDTYPGNRPHPKPLMEAQTIPARRTILGASSRDVEDDSGDYHIPGAMPPQARAAYPDGRRPPVRSDPYTRKRPIDPYMDDLEMGGHPVPQMRRDFGDARSVPLLATKRDRLERPGGDRAGFDPYGRQDGRYGGGL